MFVTALIIILAVSLVGIGYGVRAIARELDGMEETSQRLEKDEEKKVMKALEKWRNGQ